MQKNTPPRHSDERCTRGTYWGASHYASSCCITDAAIIKNDVVATMKAKISIKLCYIYTLSNVVFKGFQSSCYILYELKWYLHVFYGNYHIHNAP